MITGRLVDEAGKPLANYRMLVRLWLDNKKYENLPNEVFAVDNFFGYSHGAWREFTSREAKTDSEGRFRLEGLLDGQRYDLYAGLERIGRGGKLSHRRQHLTATAGKTIDLGDVKPTKK
jgi:hypothetical protein